VTKAFMTILINALFFLFKFHYFLSEFSPLLLGIVSSTIFRAP